MPLQYLLPLVVLGIAGIALASWAMGFARRFSIADEAVARARWLREWPDDEVTSVLLAQDRRAALIGTRAGPGIVWAFGDDTVAHRLDGAEALDIAAGLRLKLHDFAAPSVDIALAEAERRRWTDWLEENAA